MEKNIITMESWFMKGNFYMGDMEKGNYMKTVSEWKVFSIMGVAMRETGKMELVLMVQVKNITMDI